MRNRVYGTSPIKRVRRSKEDMQKVLDAITAILDGEEKQITIRHLFYCLVGQGVIPKTEDAYKSLCGHLSKWRRSEEVPWNAFADNTRWHLGSETFDSVQDALQNTVNTYRRNLWAEQNAYCEIWVEKDAIAGLVSDTADAFGIKTFVCRGFASLSSLYSAANTFRKVQAHGKEVFIHYFGDYDPSGLAIDKSITDTLRSDFGVEIHFQREAITSEQISIYNLPTRPVKKTDRRAKDWQGECVEIDALSTDTLQGLVATCITQHIDKRQWDTLQQTEKMEKETLRQILANN